MSEKCGKKKKIQRFENRTINKAFVLKYTEETDKCKA